MTLTTIVELTIPSTPLNLILKPFPKTPNGKMHKNSLLLPLIWIEVMLSSTKQIDFGKKLGIYARSIPSNVLISLKYPKMTEIQFRQVLIII